MKKCKKLLSVLLAALLLVGAVPAYAANGSGGLNGVTCDLADFDLSVYTLTRGVESINRIEWPSSGNVMIQISGKYTFDHMNGVTIPANLLVDVYSYRGRTYTFITQYDTTNGQSITVDTSNIGSNTSTNTGASQPGTSSTDKYIGTGSNTPSKPSTPVTYTHSYPDVKPDAWYYDAVMTLTEGGLLKGYDDGKFGPDDVITYAQLSVIMNRLTNGRASWDYKDVTKIDWGSEQSRYQVSRGLAAVELVDMFDNCRVNGYRYFPNNRFTSVEEFPDYDDIIAWCYKYVTEIMPVTGGGRHMCSDEQAARYYANKHILSAYELNLFNGVDSKGTFAPRTLLTRAQLCQVLYNVGWTTENCEYFVK